MSKTSDVRLGKTRVPPLPVTGELFELYQPVIGQSATLLWLNLRWAAHADTPFDVDTWAVSLHVAPKELQAAKERLRSFGLVETSADEGLIVHDPLPREAFETMYGDHGAANSGDHALRAVGDEAERGARGAGGSAPSVAGDAVAEAVPQPKLPLPGRRGARSDEPNGADASIQPSLRSPLSKRRRNPHMLKLVEEIHDQELPLNEDMQAVVQIYHKRIGMMGPTQYERLRFWVEEQAMEGAVVALAIEETVQSADVPRISYLEGILRNWFNDGIRTLADVHRQKRASKVLSGGEAAAMRQGVPNAGAYQSINPELVAKWKEMYPDEYDG